jgi:chorismate mutase/prephenate dehydratase
VKTEPTSELEALRRAIDGVDRAILERLNERARLVQQVGRCKRAGGESVYAGARERDLVARLREENAGPFPCEALGPVFREIISATRSLEARLRVAFLGPEGTFSHLGVREKFGALTDAKPVTSIEEVFGAVERDRADYGVVPLENTTEGVVTQTLDALVESGVRICGELKLRISLQLMSRCTRLDEVRRVASHPQPLAQCRRWLDRHLQGVERLEVGSTAAAADLALREDATAAIGSSLLAESRGLGLLERGIEDRSDNTTRFLVVGGREPLPSGKDLTLVVYTVRKTQAGALHALLEPFARHGVNLASIQSRPIPGKPWEYLFFLELEGHHAEDALTKAMSEADALAHSSRLLGSFPRAELPGRPEAER